MSLDIEKAIWVHFRGYLKNRTENDPNMPLTKVTCDNLKPRDKAYKKYDSKGLYLLIKPNGSKYWKFKYIFAGKERLLHIGTYPNVTLKKAREERNEAQNLLNEKIDPAIHKKKQKILQKKNVDNTFKVIALEWWERRKLVLSEKHAATIKSRLEKHIFPYIGSFPITEITPEILLETLKRLETAGKYEIAKRMLQTSSQIFKYAIQTSRNTENPAIHLQGVLISPKINHHRALDIKQLPIFLKALERNECRLFPETRYAMEFMILTFVRTKELIGATWEEINDDTDLWIIPAERMKMKKDHVVPLSRQARDILRIMREINGRQKWIFPSQREPKKHMSDGTLIHAVKRLGFQSETTVHGFRAMAATAIQENLGYRYEVVDRQLAHAPKSKIDAAYHRTQFLPERRKMMQDWGNYIEKSRKC